MPEPGRRELLAQIEELKKRNAELEAAERDRRKAEAAMWSSREALVAILDSIEAHVYAADMHDHRVLFMNRSMIEDFGGDYTGQKCWRSFTLNEGPCTHCTTPRLLEEGGEPARGVVWESGNPITGRYYVNVDRAVHWIDGSLVRIQVATDITERREFEEELKESEAMLSETQAMANVGGWQLELESGEFTWTGETYRIHEVDPDYAPTLEKALSFFRPEHREDIRSLLALCADTGEAFDAEFPFRTAKGREIWVRVKGRADMDDGGIVSLRGTIQDVTDRKEAALALAESEERWRTLLHSIPAGVVVHDAQGRVTSMNAEAERLLGVSESRAASRALERHEWDFLKENGEGLPLEDFPALEVLRNGQGIANRIYGVRRPKRKHPVWIMLNAEPVLDESGGVLEVLLTFFDITAFKRAEEGRRHWLELYGKLVKASPDCITRTDPDGRITYISPKGMRLFGVKRKSEIIGSRAADWVAPEDRERAAENIARIVRGEARRTSENEYLLVRKNGESFHGAVTSSIIGEDEGEPAGMISIIRDVSEKKRMEARLLAAKEAAESASRAKSEFLANVSHEIRTPLNGVLGMLQLALLTELDEEQRDYMETALSSGRSLLTIINDVLDFSKIEAGKVEIFSEKFSLEDMLESVKEVFRHQAERKGLDLALDIDPKAPKKALGDEARLRQILINLVGNSMKFTDKGEIRVSVARVEAPGRLRFAVSDTGIGIPADKLDSIFDSFTQVDGSHARRHQGTGLGLSIVKRLAELMDGKVWAESDAGGATVGFEVDLAVEEETGEDRSEENQGPPLPAEGEKTRLLLMEDDAVNRMTLGMYLKKLGYRVDAAENGREGLEKLKAEAYEVVLMDIQMPVMDGMEAARRIRAGLRGATPPDVPIVAITAHAMQGDREKFLEAGMDEYVAKPLDLRELAGVLGRLLEERRSAA